MPRFTPKPAVNPLLWYITTIHCSKSVIRHVSSLQNLLPPPAIALLTMPCMQFTKKCCYYATINRINSSCCLTMMVLCWTMAATKDLREKNYRGKINLNIQTEAYLGNIVSGEHYPDYKAPPPNGCGTAIVRFCWLFRRIQLEQELQGHWLAERGGEEGNNRYWLYYYYSTVHVRLPSY